MNEKEEALDENENLEVDRLLELYLFRLPRSFRYAGYIWPGVTLSVERIETLNHFEFRSTDVLIVSYPKSGTTWMSELVSQLCHSEEWKLRPLHERVPWLEMENAYIWVRFYWIWQMILKVLNVGNLFRSKDEKKEEEEEKKGEIKPRMWFTHLPLELMPQQVVEGKCKVIYVCRNPKDTAVSYYHFHRMARFLGQQKIPWNTFFSLFYTGNVYCGSWFEHVTSYYKLSQVNPNVHFVKYEDMKTNLRSEIERLKEFLELDVPSELIEKVIEKVQFQAMKEDQKANRAGVWLFNQKVSQFIRKGTVGDWKNYFTLAQSELFDQVYRQQMKGTGIEFNFELK